MADDVALGDEMPELSSRLDPDAFRVDDTILEALAQGEVGPSFPVAYRRLGDLLAAVHLPATPAEATTESEALELFEALHAGGNSRRRLLVTRRLISPKVLLAAGAITVASATGAAAATGSLPGAAQDTAARVLAKIGIAVPGSDPRSGDHPDDRGEDSTTTTAPVSATVGRGDTISNLAIDQSTGGLAETVSSAASDGHRDVGDDVPSSSPPAELPSSLPAPSAVPVGPPSSPPAGPPSSLPARAPSAVPVGPPSSPPAGPPSSLPARAPSAVPVGPPSSPPAGAPSSLPAHAPTDPGGSHRP